MDYLTNVDTEKRNSVKFGNAKHRILAYRVNQQDNSSKDVLAEGSHDDEEDGAGEKLLSVLRKMDIGNIMVVVCIWKNSVAIGDPRIHPGELHKEITERAKELLQGIK